MSLQIIGAGFGRTGTHSLKLALERLGFGPCYHMVECLGKPDHEEAWSRAYQLGSSDWETALIGFRSTVDWPGAYFWRELSARYPDAKVILTERDPERWYRSAFDTIYPSSPQAKARTRDRMVARMIWEGVFDDRFEDKAHALEIFDRHNEAVKSTIAADRLLVFDASQGWEPLCRFLGCAVPEEPYPHSNTTEAFLKMIAARKGTP
jgi:hypothetical protein